MKRALIVIIIFIATQATSLQAQWLDRVTVRESVTDINAIAHPAQLQAVFNGSKLDGSAVHAGVRLDVIDPKSDYAKSFHIGPTVEWHRNYNTVRSASTFLAGVNMELIYNSAHGVTQKLLAAVEYKKDTARLTEGSQETFRYSVASKSLLMGDVGGVESMGFTWQPILGLDLEDVAKVSFGNQTGRVQRGYAAVEAAFYPAHVALSNRLEWSGSYGFWVDIFETSRLNDKVDNHQLLKTSLTAYADKGRHIGASLDYVRGENPTKGLAFQNYGGVSLRLKF